MNILGGVQKMGQATNFVRSQWALCGLSFSWYKNYPAEEQETHWGKTKKDITILNDVTSLFVLFVLVSSKAILYHVNDQLQRRIQTELKTITRKIYPWDHYIIIIITREPRPVLTLKYLHL